MANLPTTKTLSTNLLVYHLLIHHIRVFQWEVGTLQPRYNARRYSAHSVIMLIGCLIPLKNDVILQLPNILLTI